MPPNDIVRTSTAVPTQDADKMDYIVEVHQRRFNVRTFPGIKYNPGLAHTASIYVSRSATVN